MSYAVPGSALVVDKKMLYRPAQLLQYCSIELHHHAALNDRRLMCTQ